jgi:hypothetical protein
VKRIVAELRSLGVAAVKRAGRRGLESVYRLDLAKIAEITRPFWHLLGADIAVWIDATFPDESVAPSDNGEDAWRVGRTADAGASPTNVVKIEEVRRRRADSVSRAIARDVAPSAFERGIRRLVHERRREYLVFVAASGLFARYVERQFCHKIERAVRRLFPEIRRAIFTVPPG